MWDRGGGAMTGASDRLRSELSGADIELSFVGEFAMIQNDCSASPHLEAWVRRFQVRPAYKAAIDRGGPYGLAR
ncbi:MAG: glutathione S-transferase [Gammaproteobacteria bacterium]|nr:glutathione S-transferase [Gammaproteobacteria bacterium]